MSTHSRFDEGNAIVACFLKYCCSTLYATHRRQSMGSPRRRWKCPIKQPKLFCIDIAQTPTLVVQLGISSVLQSMSPLQHVNHLCLHSAKFRSGTTFVLLVSRRDNLGRGIPVALTQCNYFTQLRGLACFEWTGHIYLLTNIICGVAKILYAMTLMIELQCNNGGTVEARAIG